MNDQANRLRELVGKTQLNKNNQQLQPSGASTKQALPAPSNTRVIVVTSGKGGVGKSNLVLNLAIALAKMKQRVLVMDADLGLANLDVLLGISPKYTLQHVIFGEKRLEEIIIEPFKNVRIIPASSGIQALANLKPEQIDHIIAGFASLGEQVNFFLIDTGAGISESVTSFAFAAQEVIIVTTPEPTAITDAYAMMKVLWTENSEIQVRLFINMAQSRQQALQIGEKIQNVTKAFLKKDIAYIGFIPYDNAVQKAVILQKPFMLSSPHSPVAEALMQFAGELTSQPIERTVFSSVRQFFRKISGKR